MKRSKKIVLVMSLVLFCQMTLLAQQEGNQMHELATIKQNIKSKRISSYDRTGNNNDRITFIEDGKTVPLCNIEGAGIINHIWITIAPLQPNINRNDIILRMYWDGQDFPSVESPLGPFFGQGWNESYNYTAMPLSASPANGNALVSYFAMPFEKGAKIEIENQSGITIEAFYYYIDYVEYKKLPSDMGRFHAWYNNQLTAAPPEGENEWQLIRKDAPNKHPERNYLIADVKGKGQFVGVNYYVNSPSPMWYGEGDDMFFIDGDETPTLHGTGTEDYFNTSWCPKEVYTHPYFGYTRVNNQTGWLGKTHLYRFHITDPVFFDTSLKFTIEHGHNNGLTLDLASVAYWYQSDAAPLPEAISKEDRQPLPEIGHREIFKWRQEWRKSKGNDPALWGNE